MVQPQNVIYLPPGVVPAAPAPPPPPEARAPFDRQFFEAVLPQAVASFCKQVNCGAPRVELFTTDGSTHFVTGISGVTDAWVAVQAARDDHPHIIQAFVPYQTVYRVEIHAESDESRRHLGFVAPTEVQVPPAVQPRRPSARLKQGDEAKGSKKKA